MTNTTKNKKNALEHRPAQAPPAAAENERLTMEELLEKNAELERRLRKYKGISNLLVWSILSGFSRKTKKFKDFHQSNYSTERRGWESQARFYTLRRDGDE